MHGINFLNRSEMGSGRRPRYSLNNSIPHKCHKVPTVFARQPSYPSLQSAENLRKTESSQENVRVEEHDAYICRTLGI